MITSGHHIHPHPGLLYPMIDNLVPTMRSLAIANEAELRWKELPVIYRRMGNGMKEQKCTRIELELNNLVNNGRMDKSECRSCWDRYEAG